MKKVNNWLLALTEFSLTMDHLEKFTDRGKLSPMKIVTVSTFSFPFGVFTNHQTSKCYLLNSLTLSQPITFGKISDGDAPRIVDV